MDVSLKIREHEEEILQLRKQLAEFSVKVMSCFFSPLCLHSISVDFGFLIIHVYSQEAQVRNEKYVLEKRIAYMRLVGTSLLFLPFAQSSFFSSLFDFLFGNGDIINKISYELLLPGL